MYRLHTTKQRKYFFEAIRLHFEAGYGSKKISRLLPVTPSTISEWIAIFASEKGNVSEVRNMKKNKKAPPRLPSAPAEDVKALQARIRQLEKQLLMAEVKAEFYDEMINVAEAKFKISIRKKAGAKQ